MRYSLIVITIALAVGGHVSEAEARLDLYVDKSTQRIAVVQDGYMRYVWPVSTGRDGYATPNGVYSPERLERSWFSREYYDAPMPYAIFFHNGYAIHGSYDLNRLGGPASHGCIRLYPQHAALLFAMVEQEGPENTTIVVGGDGGPIPRAPRFRDMDELVRSVVSGDGGQPLARPRGVPSRDGGEPPGWPIDGNGQYAALGGNPNGDLYRNPEMPGRNGNVQGPPAFRPGDPRYEPNRDMARDMGRYPDAPFRPGDNNAQWSGPGAPPFPPPRRDIGSAKQAPRIARNDPDESAGSRLTANAKALTRQGDNDPRLGAAGAPAMGPRRDTENFREAPPRTARSEPNESNGGRPNASASAKPPARQGDSDAQLAGPGTPPAAVPRREADNAKEALPWTARSEPDEFAGGRTNATANATEPMQAGPGYKILPKSYWTGASWRWRSNGEPDAR